MRRPGARAEPARASSSRRGRGGDAMRLGAVEIVLLILVVIGLIVAVRAFAGRAGSR